MYVSLNNLKVNKIIRILRLLLTQPLFDFFTVYEYKRGLVHISYVLLKTNKKVRLNFGFQKYFKSTFVNLAAQ